MTTETEVINTFLKFHKTLGFSEIKIQPFFPDCIAKKDGKEVKIEFEVLSYGLLNHLRVGDYIHDYHKVIYTEKALVIIYIFERGEGTIFEYLVPKENYVIKDYGRYFRIFYKKLPIDYCVCLRDNGYCQRIKELNNVNVIELEKLFTSSLVQKSSKPKLSRSQFISKIVDKEVLKKLENYEVFYDHSTHPKVFQKFDL